MDTNEAELITTEMQLSPADSKTKRLIYSRDNSTLNKRGEIQENIPMPTTVIPSFINDANSYTDNNATAPGPQMSHLMENGKQMNINLPGRIQVGHRPSSS